MNGVWGTVDCSGYSTGDGQEHSWNLCADVVPRFTMSNIKITSELDVIALFIHAATTNTYEIVESAFEV
jgi:hypothetical protein